MPKADILLTPGPTPLPPQVREALGRSIQHHRTGQYRQLFARVVQNLKTVMQTSQTVCCLISSGTGAMEAAVVNLLSPGDEAIVILGGKFAERWQNLCRAHGIHVFTVPVEYGDAVDPDKVESALKTHPKAKAVFAILLETSTGVVHDIKRLAAITRKSEAVLVVDAISALLAEPCETDAWGIDVLVTGSQKGLMLPPGLAFLSLNQRSLALVQQAKAPRFYYDLRLYLKTLGSDDTPFTSSVSLVIALDEALKLVLDRGLPQVLKRCATMAQATRRAMGALGLTIFAKKPANGLTAVNVPSGVDGKQLTKLMYERSRVMVAGGQGELAGKIFRFAHMGYISPEDVLAGIAALEDALGALGKPHPTGEGIKAAQSVFGTPSTAGVK